MKLLRWIVPLTIAAAVVLTAPHLQGRGDAANESAAPSSPLADGAFWKLWGDGQAELASYDLIFPRYGELRKGTAVLVFVTESFSNEARVKADPGKHPKSDEFPVMKLNRVQDFSTGVYDYNLMTSVFVALSAVNGAPAGVPTKITFSAQEWCGHVFHELLFGERGIRSVRYSYFDGEGDQDWKLERKAGGFAEDALLHWARGLAEPRLASGESKQVPFLISCQTSRLQHRPVEWTTATLSRGKGTHTIQVPAGLLEVETFKADIADGRKWTIDVEAALPHRIVRWESSDGEKGELLAADRMKYWEMNEEKFSGDVRRLHLTPRPQRTM
ncbi:MAG TPA: hypothetical protein VFR10_07655 [bacterium]|nr:hypothetical protein [bacterium]